MPPSQDDNPFGVPRGAWGRQPPTTFGLPVKGPSRSSNQIRVPAPSLAPRNILTGGLAPQTRPQPAPVTPPPAQPAPPEIKPAPMVEPPDASLVSDSVLARTAPSARIGGLPFPPVAGIGVVIAAIVAAGLLLLRHEPPAPAPVTTPEASAPVHPPAPEVNSKPRAEAPAAVPVVRTARAATTPQPRRVAPVAEAPAPITPPPLAAPPIVTPPPQPAPAAAIPPPTDPEVPMTTRLPGPQ